MVSDADSQSDASPSDDLLDRLEDELFAIDGDTVVTHWNDRIAETSGVDANDAVGSAVGDLGLALAESQVRTAIDRVLDGEAEQVDVDAGFSRFDGDVVRVHGDEGGAVVQILSHATETRRDAMLLEDLLDGLLVETGDTVYFKDEESRFVHVSRSKAEEVGVSREEIRGKTDFDFMPEEMARKRYEDEQRIMETGAPLENPDERLVTADGDVRWLKSEKLPWYDDEGEIVGTFGISRDVTELKELEETLAELEELVDRVSVWLLALDRDGVVTWANSAASRTLAGTDGDLLDRPIDALVGDGPLVDDFVAEYEDCVDRLLADPSCDDAAVIHDVEIEASDGERRICNVHVRLLPLAGDQFRGTVVAFHDVTKQVEQERTLQRQYERLERLVETISHDLRNPLMVAAGKVGLAAAETDSEALDEAAVALERMETLVDQLLMMAREGRDVDDPAPVSIREVATEAWRPFEDSDVVLSIENDATVSADRGRLVRLFENLFRNAVEHGADADPPASMDGVGRDSTGHQQSGDAGGRDGPHMTIQVGSTGEGFFVADDGPGIPPDVQGAVFDHGYTTSDDGTGLGLSIVAEIVAAHDWSITVGDSERGGARFDVETRS